MYIRHHMYARMYVCLHAIMHACMYDFGSPVASHVLDMLPSRICAPNNDSWLYAGACP